ncbi:MAG: DUF364 domain-containing protein [Candidatus Thiodiazotropha lotti]|nr:DUF364 domain-containing protein [Candidatus Thiodiazotropha lotti]MCG8004870.1 DUF364 domain-containing protein [Candidatus Thiodiazotropha lotti]MCG8006835.1 DUF364 domain-containing protein [Candidatus Thiodiazotropha lotti]MCW4188497.1 DUF364 domain-containing protein [Candidatus Thiodiazotropha lotti]MCW4194417.1 DUF364 domain-containing protein [Candidatus Thiodiazotropha lotti]
MNAHHPWSIYQQLLDQLTDDGRVEEVQIGLTWTLVRDQSSTGLAMSPGSMTRVLPWSGTLVGRNLKQLAGWVKSWNQHEAAIGMAALNAEINSNNPLTESATPLFPKGSANLAVFEHFKPQLTGKKVVVIGRYPGIEHRLDGDFELTILERNPTSEDLPDPAAEFLLRDAEWVFLSATTLINKTFPRLAELSREAQVVLMGPTTPWLEIFKDYGIDYLAGVQIHASEQLWQTAREGGGTRIFETGVRYAIADLQSDQLTRMKGAIGSIFNQREGLKKAMEAWYQQHNQPYPGKQNLLQLDQQLSRLDSHYKQEWDGLNC